MLDVIQKTGTPGTRSYFRVYDTCYPVFNDLEGNYDPIRFLIVASANYDSDGNIWDWEAYKGCAEQDADLSTAMQMIANHGNKLGEREVKFFLHGQPELTKLLRKYRN